MDKAYVALLVLKLSLEAADAQIASAKLQQDLALLTAELRKQGCSVDDHDVTIARPLDD